MVDYIGVNEEVEFCFVVDDFGLGVWVFGWEFVVVDVYFVSFFVIVGDKVFWVCKFGHCLMVVVL